MTNTAINKLCTTIYDCAAEVHKTIGNGMLHELYFGCLCAELQLRGISFKTALSIPLKYKGLNINQHFNIDLLVEDQVVVKVISEQQIEFGHEAYLKSALLITGKKTALLFNFNSRRLIDGYKRMNQNF